MTLSYSYCEHLGALEQVQLWTYSQANADVEERREERDDNLALS